MYAQTTNTQSPRGLFMVTMEIDNKPGTHYGIMDVGNVLVRPGVHVPTIYHLRPDGSTWTTDTSRLRSSKRIADETGATARFEAALHRSSYDVLTNNCEHFARLVAEGEHKSGQAVVVGIVGMVSLVGVFALLDRWLGRGANKAT